MPIASVDASYYGISLLSCFCSITGTGSEALLHARPDLHVWACIANTVPGDASEDNTELPWEI